MQPWRRPALQACDPKQGLARSGKHLLGLCSGNYCASGGDGRQRGNGRLVAVTLHEAPSGRCSWVPDRVIRLPPTAYFAEFTSLAFRGNRTLISSRARAPLLRT